MIMRALVRALLALALALAARPAWGQRVTVRDLVLDDAATTMRLVGYGLVTGLNGTGDLTSSGRQSQHTVQSVANLLRRFDISVPPELLRTRNVAAVVVTAEVSPYLRPGGRFDVQVASLGDARSLRGGVLWMTPLVTGPDAPALATAQGPVVLDEQAGYGYTSYQNVWRRRTGSTESSARIPAGGLLDTPLPRPAADTGVTHLYLREPNATTAARFAAAIDSSLGSGTATVDDPGSITLTFKDSLAAGGRAGAIARVLAVTVDPSRPARLVLDARSGAVVLGGDLRVGPSAIAVAGVTLSIGAPAADTTGREEPGERAPAPTTLRLAAGVSVQDVVQSLQTLRTPPNVVAAVFDALRQAGALNAEVVLR